MTRSRERDLAALCALPRALLAAGYTAALHVRGMLTVSPEIAVDLEVLPPATATLVELFFLRRRVERDRLQRVLGDELVTGLLGLGVLVERDGLVSTMDLVALPVLGQLALVPSPGRSPAAFFGDDVALLLVQLMSTRGSVLVLGAGSGIIPLHAAQTASRVVAVEPDPIAGACAELTFAMNGATNIELRTTPIEAATTPAERFDRIAVVAPTMPVPVGAGALAGPEALGQAVARLPALLAEDGSAQLVGVWHGGEGGPIPPLELVAFAQAHRLRVVTTLISRQALAVGSPLFEAFAGGLARARGVDPQLVRQEHQRFLAQRGVTHLYLALMTITPASEGAVELTRHWTRPGGGWQR